MRLVAPTLPQTLKFSLVKVVLENRLVVRVGTLVNNDPGALTRRHTTDVGETLLGNDDVEIVLGLIDMGYLGDDAGYSGGIIFGGAGGGGMHDGVFGGAQEVGRASETVQDAGAHDAGGVGVGVDINLNGGVHTSQKSVRVQVL